MRRTKKRKLNIKKSLRIIIPLIIIVILFINRNNLINYYQSKITGYNINTVEVFHELNIYDDVKKLKYSDTLENVVNSEYYNNQYLKDYLNIDYYNKDNYLININTLLNLGYSADDINNIYSKLSDESINLLLKSYLKDITNIINLSYFLEDRLDRYLEYSKNNDALEVAVIIKLVNNDIDKLDNFTYDSIILDLIDEEYILDISSKERGNENEK